MDNRKVLISAAVASLIAAGAVVKVNSAHAGNEPAGHGKCKTHKKHKCKGDCGEKTEKMMKKSEGSEAGASDAGTGDAK